MRKRYLTGLFEGEPANNPTPPFKGRGWHGEYKDRVVRLGGDRDDKIDPRGMGTVVPKTTKYHDDGTITVTYVPEIVICHDTRIKAQGALNLITAVYPILFGTGPLEETTACPEDESDPEDLRGFDLQTLPYTKTCTGGIATCCAIAAKASHRRRWIYAISKLWVSYRICSVDWGELHPSYGSQFGVEREPVHHVLFAQAIISAYSALEELELEVRASTKNPSRIAGKWNPMVLNDLRKRLADSGIDLSSSYVWNLRNTPTRIEKSLAPPLGDRPPWARYSVRDRLVRIEDAIGYASYQRSQISAHRTSSRTRSRTIYDVDNVQRVARRLILESLGFWPLG